MIKKIFLFIFVCLLTTTQAFAENFYIKNYDVNLTVNKLKQVHVTETIDAYFTNSSHGIIRRIPTGNNAEILNIKVSEPRNVSYESSGVAIRIGDANKYITGDHKYVISYDYDIFDNKDEFYFNIIGTQWNTPINHVTFRVDFPTNIDKEKTGLSIGTQGTAGFNGGAIFTIGENFVSGETSRILQPNEGITLRTEVPKDFFYDTGKNKQKIPNRLIFVFTLTSLVLWFIYGKDDKPIPVVNFHAPNNMDLLDMELAYRESASMHGVVATIIDLARKGYVKIYDDKKDFKIEKLKDYPKTGGIKAEKDIMDGLFNGAKVGKCATKNKLQKSHCFYSKCIKLVSGKNEKRDKIYDEKSNSLSLQAIMLVPIALNSLVMMYAYDNFCMDIVEAILVGIIPVGIVLLTILLTFWNIFGGEKSKYPNFSKSWRLLLIALPTQAFFAWLWSVRPYAISTTYLAFWGIIVCSFCAYHITKRNKTYLRILGDLLGLKKFIQTAEKEKLERLVEEDPEYFYEILPLAYLLDVSDKWIKKFEKIMDVKPDWFEGNDFQARSFDHFSSTIYGLAQPSYENGGFSSSSSGGGGGYSSSFSSGGGGSSGGGYGGGGGSSW